MLTGLDITDIFGSKSIDENTSFIIVNYKKLNSYIRKVSSVADNNIYKLDIDRLAQTLNKEYRLGDINFCNFIPVGDVCSRNGVNNIILANKHVVPTTKRYNKVGEFNGLHLWIGELKRKGKISRSMGVVTTDNPSPPDSRIPVLPRSFLVKMDFRDGIIRGNEFNTLNYKEDGLWMIVRNKFNRSMDNFRLLGNNGKYLSSFDNKLKTKSKNSNGQNVSYNVQGELVMNGLCITANDGNNVGLDKCKSDRKQKWFPYNGNFISMMDDKFNTCLSVDNKDNITTKTCNLSSDAEWDMQYTDPQNRSYSWPKTSGKIVALVEKDNPWYLNKDIVGNKIYINNNYIPTTPYYKNYANVKPGCKIDHDHLTQNMAYSYANKHKKCVEGFEEESENDDTYALVILVLIIIMIVLIKYHKSYKLV